MPAIEEEKDIIHAIDVSTFYGIVQNVGYFIKKLIFLFLTTMFVYFGRIVQEIFSLYGVKFRNKFY